MFYRKTSCSFLNYCQISHSLMVFTLQEEQVWPWILINGSLDGIKISFFGYQYKTIDDFSYYNNIRLAGLKDIAAMKMEAIAGRGSKKDFVDIYFLLQQYTLDEIFEFHTIKYGKGLSNRYHHLKSLVYFKDADSEAMPLMMNPLKWDDVKKQIITIVRQFDI